MQQQTEVSGAGCAGFSVPGRVEGGADPGEEGLLGRRSGPAPASGLEHADAVLGGDRPAELRDKPEDGVLVAPVGGAAGTMLTCTLPSATWP